MRDRVIYVHQDVWIMRDCIKRPGCGTVEHGVAGRGRRRGEKKRSAQTEGNHEQAGGEQLHGAGCGAVLDKASSMRYLTDPSASHGPTAKTGRTLREVRFVVRADAS